MEPNMGMTRNSVSKVIRIVMRRWYWPLIFAALFAVGFSFFFWSRYNATYQVSSTMIPLNAQTNYYTASALIKNDEVLNAVKKSVDFDTTIGALDGAIDIDTSEDSAAVAVSITWRSKQEAFEILEALKANLTFAVTHSAEAGDIIWMDAATSDSDEQPITAMQSYRVFGIGALIGLLVGIGFALLLGAVDKRVFDLEAVNYGSAVSVIGAVGRIKKGRKQSVHSRESAPMSKSQKQVIAAGLYLNKLMQKNNKKVLMCVAPTSKCGNTTITRNIANVLSGIRKNILIIKLTMNTHVDPKAPKMRSLFPEVFEYALSWNDSESYKSFLGRLSSILSLVTKKFNLVLIDCPPLLDNTQISIFAEGMDAALVVGRYGKTKYDDVSATVSLLSRFGAKPIYCTWNFADKYYDDFYPSESTIDE